MWRLSKTVGETLTRRRVQLQLKALQGDDGNVAGTESGDATDGPRAVSTARIALCKMLKPVEVRKRLWHDRPRRSLDA